MDGRRFLKIILHFGDEKIVDTVKPFIYPQDLHICPDGNHHYTSKNQKSHDFSITVSSFCLLTGPQGTVISTSGTNNVWVFNDVNCPVTTTSSMFSLSIKTSQITSTMIYYVYSKDYL